MAKKATRELVLKAKDQGTGRVKKNVSGLRSEVDKMKLSWSKVGRGVAAVGAAGVAATGLLAAGVGALGVSFIKTGSQVEQYRIKLRTVIKDQERADRLFRELVEFAGTTPFELPGVVEAAIQLEAFGIDSVKHLTTVGNAASAMGFEVTDAALAVVQGMSGEMEMLKRFTITGAQLEQEFGKINRGTVAGQEKALKAILETMETKFAGGMERARVSWQGTLSMFADHWFKLRQQIAEGGMFDAIKGDLRDILAAVDRFSEKGGVEAIALGFNNAFDTIHDVFFGGLIDDIDNFKGQTGELALHIERTMLGVAKTLAEVERPFIAIRAWIEQLSEIEQKGRLGRIPELLPGVALFKAAAKREDLSKGLEERSKRLTDSIAEVNLAMSVLMGDTTLSMEEQIRAYELLNKRGILGTGKLADPDAFFVGPLQPKPETLKAAATGAAKTYWDEFAAYTPELRVPQQFQLAFEGPPRPGGDEFVPFVGEQEGPFQKLYGDEAVAKVLENLDIVSMAENEYVELSTARTVDSLNAEMAYREFAAEHAMQMFDKMGRYQEIFARKGMNIGRAVNAMMIRGAGQAAKAAIGALVAKAKVEAQMYAADALYLLATGQVGAAATMAAAAAKKGAVIGAAGIAQALIEREVAEREAELTDRIDTMPAEGGGGAVGGRGTRTKGSASTVRTGNQVNNFYIMLINNVDGDYVTHDGDATAPEQIQDLFNEGVVQIPS
jgi:hypothetical protein